MFLFSVSNIHHKAQPRIRAILFKETNLKFVKFVFNLLMCVLQFIFLYLNFQKNV